MPPKLYSHKQYDQLIKDTVAAIHLLSAVKGGEYAGDVDRLANFRRNGLALSMPMEAVWAVYAGKHWDSIQQYVKDLNAGRTRPRAEPLEGRADDLIVYLILFKAILAERQQNEGNKEAPEPGLDSALPGDNVSS